MTVTSTPPTSSSGPKLRSIPRSSTPRTLADTTAVQFTDGGYPLSSLYPDSADLRFCNESLDGTKDRYRLRIRSYVMVQTNPGDIQLSWLNPASMRGPMNLPRVLVSGHDLGTMESS